VSSLAEYFHTDWEAMTATDWFGTLLTVGIFFLMALAYFLVFRPKNRESLEARKYLPFAEDSLDADGDRNGGGHG
jgi:cytochrome c oxidase cbb3-type subunit 4